MSKKRYVTFGSLFLSKEKDSQGRPSYYIKLDKDIELTINGEKYNKSSISAKNVITKYEEMIGRAGEKGDEEKVEQYETTKSRFEKGGDLDYIKHEFTVVLD